MLGAMAQSDRQIPEKERCQACGGAGWKPFSAEGSDSKWVVCRECIGTGRTDKTGRKRNKPE